MNLFLRIRFRLWSVRGNAATGALVLVGITLARLLADIPRLSAKIQMDGWGGVEGVLGGIALLIAMFAIAAMIGAILGAICGLLTRPSPQPEESSTLQTTWKRLE